MTLPNNWTKCKFSDIADIRNGYAFSKSDFLKETNGDNSIPLVKQTQLAGDKVDLTRACYLPAKFLTKYSDFQVKKGDVLIGMSGSIGKLCIYQHDFPALQNQHTGLIKTYTDEIDNKFFWFFLQTVEAKLMSDSKGVGVQNISSNDIGDIELSLPPLPEQHRIVAKIDALFSELDNAVALLKTIKAQLAIYRQAVLQWAFEGKLTMKWRKINVVESNKIVIKNIMTIREMENCRDKYKDIELEFPLYDLPKEWKWVSIGCISKGVEYGTSAKSNKNGKVVVLRMGNIQNGTFVYDDLAYTSNKKEIEKYKLNENDVLFNRTNSPELVGKTAIYTGSVP
jgi:type I restriction enzyme S subunit